MANVLQIRFIISASDETRWHAFVEAISEVTRKPVNVYRSENPKPLIEAMADVERFLVYYDESVTGATGSKQQ